jgi:hypothetical protein
MYLYDNITPPLDDGSYRFDVNTGVSAAGAAQALPGATSYFDVIGPRFSLPVSDLGGVFPPRNARGSFAETLPQIALSRRTLPWERALDPEGRIGTPTRAPGDPPPPTPPPPWVALLLFEEGEYTFLPNQPLESVVPPDVFARLGSPQGITCDAVQASLSLVSSIMPSLEELSVLAHVRQVNFDDRELSAGSSDGWFAVVMSNRVPNPNAKCLACLVSLEERSDLVPKDPPPAYFPIIIDSGPLSADHPAAAPASAIGPIGPFPPWLVQVSLVVLYSWKFEVVGPVLRVERRGTFFDLMQGLDVGFFGTVADPGHPPLSDTGHLPISLGDRAGVEEIVWYRGPLVPFQLTRDPLGPYHSADQCRRATPETGAEDVSYACAFEVGRLLAAADARLAQELMRWRREPYKQAARATTFTAVGQAVALTQALDIHQPSTPILSASATASVVKGSGPVADVFGVAPLVNLVGLNPQALQQAWSLASPQEAQQLLGGAPGTLGASVTVPPATTRASATIDQVAADAAGLQHLANARDRLLVSTAQKLGGMP